MKKIRVPVGSIPPYHLDKIYNLVEQAIQNTDPDGKTTDQIFGEIFTRFRADATRYGGPESLRSLFSGRLKYLNKTVVGDELNQIINELYEEHAANEEAIMDLELCTTIMDDCLLDAKEVTRESSRVIVTLDQISNDFNGESNV